MELFYCKLPRGNFGDDLNLWLWDALLPGWQAMGGPDDTLFGAGTLLSAGNLEQFTRPVIFGSGVGYGATPDGSALKRCRFRAVRGPITARICGLPETIPMLDPAMLCPDLPNLPELPAADHGTIFVPHHTSAALGLRWKVLCDDGGIEFVSPEGDAKEVIARIARADLVIAESMHAAILADAFRVPWIPVQLSDSFNREKWRDWALALDLDPAIPDLLRSFRWMSRNGPAKPASERGAAGRNPPASPPRSSSGRRYLKKFLETFRGLVEGRIRAALRDASTLAPCLSDASRLAARQAAFRGELDRFRDDFG